jgi:endonuclease YncB( thermonuclease family)
VMPKGLLEITGTLSVQQFWPNGESDGDTAKVVVKKGAFRFRAKPGAAWKVTHAFDNATVKKSLNARSGKAAIDKKGQITIRWQGIDAPELHYRPTVENLSDKQKAALKAVNGNFRQPLGETASVALGKYLAKLGKDPVNVTVRTAVDQPSDVFDVYGRLIGDIFVKVSGKEVDLNLWMVQNGWAFPTFYSSMAKEEIQTILSLASKAKAKKAGIWKSASSIMKFDSKLVFDKSGPPNAAKDAGPVIMPKLFRRVSTYSVEKKAKIFSGSFPDFLKAHKDACYETSDFLQQGVVAAQHRQLDEFVTNKGFLVGPGDLVFQEAGSVVLGKNGKPAVW